MTAITGAPAMDRIPQWGYEWAIRVPYEALYAYDNAAAHAEFNVPMETPWRELWQLLWFTLRRFANDRDSPQGGMAAIRSYPSASDEVGVLAVSLVRHMPVIWDTLMDSPLCNQITRTLRMSVCDPQFWRVDTYQDMRSRHTVLGIQFRTYQEYQVAQMRSMTVDHAAGLDMTAYSRVARDQYGDLVLDLEDQQAMMRAALAYPYQNPPVNRISEAERARLMQESEKLAEEARAKAEQERQERERVGPRRMRPVIPGEAPSTPTEGTYRRLVIRRK